MVLRGYTQLRTWQPGGTHYGTAATLGGFVALVGVLTESWGWWSILVGGAVGGVALWSVSMVSAFVGWSTRLSGVDHLTRLRAAAAMRVPPEATKRGIERVLHSTPLRLYGPSAWSSEREMSVSESSIDGSVTVNLQHGSPVHLPWLAVECAYKARFIDEEFELAKRNKERSLWLEEQPGPSLGLSLEDFERWHEERDRAFEQAPRREWRSVQISFDDGLVPFEILGHDDQWTAIGRIGWVIISVWVRGVPLDQLALVTMNDVTPYFNSPG